MALACLFLSIFITPEILIWLGPMKRSLLSDIETVRKVALFEVKILKIICFIFAILLGFFGIFWRKINNLSIINRINNHQFFYDEIYEEKMGAANHSLFLIVLISLTGLLYMAVAEQLFTVNQLKFINMEDGVIENMTAVFFLGAGILSVLLCVLNSRHLRPVIVFSLFSLLFFIMVGEEINWGQRIFNYATPDFIKPYHLRKEMNIHNAFGYIADHLFVAAVFVYGFILPVLARVTLFWRKVFDYLELPIASMGLAIGFFFISMLQSWTVCRFLDPPPGFRIEELRELLTAIAFCVLMYESLIRFRQKNCIS